MATNKANPNLASQAPKVNIIIKKNIIEGLQEIITNIVNDKIINSKYKRVIKKCLRWRNTANRADIMINKNNGKIWKGIVLEI